MIAVGLKGASVRYARLINIGTQCDCLARGHLVQNLVVLNGILRVIPSCAHVSVLCFLHALVQVNPSNQDVR